MSEVVGIRFKEVGKIYYFDPLEFKLNKGDRVIVETIRGIECGEVALGNKEVDEEEIIKPLKPIIRVATPDDLKVIEKNKKKEKEAFDICLKKIAAHGLDMKLIDVEYTFDSSKVIFYFTSDGRVDFRELVKDLASVFRIRIELRQIGVRDEAKIIGGVGICGEPLCCHRFLTDFSPVSIKMAKEQNLSLNPTKISGCCGRLLCCLNYENEHYVESNRRAKEEARAAREAAAREKELAASLDAAAYPDEKEEVATLDEHTEITVETYYDPSLVTTTVDAIKHDNSHSRRSSGKSHDSRHSSSRHESTKKDQKPKKSKRPPVERDESALPKEEKIRKPRKRGSRGGRGRNKSNGNKSNSSK